MRSSFALSSLLFSNKFHLAMADLSSSTSSDSLDNEKNHLRHGIEDHLLEEVEPATADLEPKAFEATEVETFSNIRTILAANCISSLRLFFLCTFTYVCSIRVNERVYVF